MLERPELNSLFLNARKTWTEQFLLLSLFDAVDAESLWENY